MKGFLITENFRHFEHQPNNDTWRWHKDYSDHKLISTPWLQLVEPTGPHDVVYVGDCPTRRIPMSKESFYEQSRNNKVSLAYRRLVELSLSSYDDFDKFNSAAEIVKELGFLQWESELFADEEF